MRSERGVAVHFLTAPEVGPLFGAVRPGPWTPGGPSWASPNPFTVIDWGAGPGTLARSVLAAERTCMACEARCGWCWWSCRPAAGPASGTSSSAALSGALPQGAPAGVVVANELLAST